MSDQALHRTGYAAGHRRSPGALTAAIALNGGAFALILLMPATQYIVDHGPDFVVRSIPLTPDPPEVRPDPVKPKVPMTQPTVTTPPDDIKLYVQPPIVPMGGGSDVIGGTIPNLREIGDTTLLTPPVAPHQPAFVKATQDPRYASAFHPDYPAALRRQGLEGSVTVRVTIDETGRVTACDLVKTTDKAFYEETRDQALRHWRFRPATSDGTPVISEQTLTVTFTLEDL